METFYAELLQLLDAHQRLALATVVGTRGSTPQKPGAKAVFFPDGRITGTIGGGCLEAEARLRALEVIKSGHRLAYDMHLDEDFGWDDGHLCGGSAQILLDGDVARSAAVLRATHAEVLRRQRAVLAMVVSAPDEALIGARLLIAVHAAQGGEGESACEVLAADEGIPVDLQEAVTAGAGEAVRRGRELTRPLSLPGSPSLADSTENGDAGSAPAVTVYYEPLLPKPALLICGGGHVGAALCTLGAFLGFEVTVVDDRPEFANPRRHPDAVATICDDVPSAVRRFPITPDTSIVIVTRGHRNDAQVLREVIHSPAAYLGMIGSRRKVFVMRDGFLEEGVATLEDFARVHAPIGLDLGATTVEEIALSIAAELVLVRSGREASLRKLSDAVREHPATSRR